jgi:hypothetical protein
LIISNADVSRISLLKVTFEKLDHRSPRLNEVDGIRTMGARRQLVGCRLGALTSDRDCRVQAVESKAGMDGAGCGGIERAAGRGWHSEAGAGQFPER